MELPLAYELRSQAGALGSDVQRGQLLLYLHRLGHY